MISLALWSTQDCLAFVGHISHNLMPCSVTHSRMLKEGSSDVSGSPTWESTSTAGPRQSTGYFPSDTGVILGSHGSASLCRDGQKTTWRL